jgi:hypothetical protein
MSFKKPKERAFLKGLLVRLNSPGSHENIGGYVPGRPAIGGSVYGRRKNFKTRESTGNPFL